jgi:hypothetical protein
MHCMAEDPWPFDSSGCDSTRAFDSSNPARVRQSRQSRYNDIYSSIDNVVVYVLLLIAIGASHDPELSGVRALSHVWSIPESQACTPSLCIAAHENFNIAASFFSIMAG